jgi:hypothetical protein
MKDNAVIVTNKPSEFLMDNRNNIFQQEKTNSEKVLISNENQLLKKINDNKEDEGDERDNINDLKESLSNTGKRYSYIFKFLLKIYFILDFSFFNLILLFIKFSLIFNILFLDDEIFSSKNSGKYLIVTNN